MLQECGSRWGPAAEVLGAPMRPQDVVGDVMAAEAEGFGSAWTVHFSRGVNALSVLAVAGTRTSRIDLGVGIVPTYPRHPLALAQQAATTQAFCGGRLTLGVGVSHRPVIEDLHGLPYQQPAAHMRDYLSVLVPLLREGSVCYRGNFYEVDGGFAVPGTATGLGAGGRALPADGPGRRRTRRRGRDLAGRAAHAGGADRAAAAPLCRRADGEPGRTAGGGRAARGAAGPTAPRPGRPRTGCSPATPGSTTARLLESRGVDARGALAVTGDETAIEKQLGRLADAGVAGLWPIIFPVGDDPGRQARRGDSGRCCARWPRPPRATGGRSRSWPPGPRVSRAL